MCSACIVCVVGFSMHDIVSSYDMKFYINYMFYYINDQNIN